MEFQSNIWALIEGEPFRSRVEKYRADRIAAASTWVDWAMANGGSGNVFGDPNLFGIEITQSKIPTGWVKIKHNRFNVYRPKKGTSLYKAYKALPTMPTYRAVFSESDIPTNLNWHAPGGISGGGMLGYAWDPIKIGWFGNTFVVMGPNVPGYVAKHLEQYPESIIENGLTDWKLPEGLKQITESEYKLLSAQHAVEQEKAKTS